MTSSRKMSLQIGIGASQSDLEVQGEIDFDFFSEENPNDALSTAPQTSDVRPKPPNFFQTPLITVSYHEETGEVCKTSIETRIPSPAEYKENKCGGVVRSVVNEPISDEFNKGEDSETISSSSSESSFEEYNSDDSMTDVTPLPSRCLTPVEVSQSCQNDAPIAMPQPSHPDTPEDESMSSSSTFNVIGGQVLIQDLYSDTSKLSIKEYQNPVNVSELLKVVKKLEIGQKAQKPVAREQYRKVNGRQVKNLSFSNEQVRAIDQENQRLLKRITAQQVRQKPNFEGMYLRSSSSSINRQKQQRQIDMDNLALLRRLEMTKATRDVNRTKLLQDYEKRSSACSSRTSMRPVSRSSTHLSSLRSSAHSSMRTSSALSSVPSHRDSRCANKTVTNT